MLYRQLKEEFQKISKKQESDPAILVLSEVEKEKIAVEELAEGLGASEELISSIIVSHTPKKMKSPASPLPSVVTAGTESMKAVQASTEQPEVSENFRVISPSLDTMIDLQSPISQKRSPNIIVTAEPVGVEVETKKVATLVKSLTAERYHHFVVGLDGSAASKIAMDTALSLRKVKGKFYGLHIENLEKSKDLPAAMKWSAISEDAETKLVSSIPKSHYSLQAVVKNPGDSTKAAFVSHVNEIDQAMYVCLGWVGRKGPKEDPSVLGSVSDVAMRSCHHPVMICKKAPPPNKPHSYVVCVDSGSDRGQWAFDVIMSLSMQVDSVQVAYVYDITDDDQGGEAKMVEIKQLYEDIFKTNGFTNTTFLPVLKEPGTPVYTALADKINEIAPDFTVVAPDLNLERKELSVSEHIIKGVKSNIIILKVPKHLQ